MFRRAKAGDNVLPRGGAKSRKKNNVIFSPLLQLNCVASVSVLFRRKEQGSSVKERTENYASERTEGNFLSSPPPSPLTSRSIFLVVKILFLFFAPKTNGNACYVGYFPCRSKAVPTLSFVRLKNAKNSACSVG